MPVASPQAPVLAQTIAFHRDPLGVLRRCRARHGPVFELRLATIGTITVVSEPAAVEPLLWSDAERAHAGEARRQVLPMASPRSVFGGDGEQHRSGRMRLAQAFSVEALEPRRAAMAQIARDHARRWPRGRPFRVLPRMRAVMDEVFVREVLSVHDDRRARALADAIGRMLWTPGNPPAPIPAQANDGLVGVAGTAFFKHRHAPVSALIMEEVEARRAGASARDDDAIAGLMGASPEHSPGAIADELLAVLMAAQEPPATATTWLLDRLGREPGLADRFLSEPPGSPAREAIVKETLRLRPAAVAALRRLTAPMDVDGHTLGPGTLTMVPIPLMHRDPDAFPDPDRFDPARWTAGSPPETTFLPFGGGARRCIGERLAHMHIDTVVPAILEQVRLQPVWPTTERMVVRATTLVPHRSGLMRAS
jgi:cytochrome P450